MKLEELFQIAIDKGIEYDPRGKEKVEEALKRIKKSFEELKEDDKNDFDKENLTNPYSDSRILIGDPQKEIKRAMVGIDIEVGEVLLADRLSDKGQTIDLLIAHHPEGKGLTGLYEVMHLQEDILNKFGVPINVAEGMMAPRIGEVKRSLLPLNHNKAIDAARILDIPLICVHTPADNMVTTYLQNLIDETKPEILDDVIKILKKIPEYKAATQIGAGPIIVVGDSTRRAGKVFVDMTGGTGGSQDAYSKLAQAGVGTLIGMHIGEKHREECEKNHINVIIAGHMASDSLGMNLILDELENKGVEVIPCAGLTRFKR